MTMKIFNTMRPIQAVFFSLLLAAMPFFTTGCSQQPVEVVTKVVTQLTNIEPYISQAQILANDFRVLDPQLADQVQEYAQLAKVNLASIIKIGNDYIARPSANGYQALLNAADSLVASVDTQVLAAAKISNPVSQQKVLVLLGLFATGLHIVLGILMSNSSKTQVQNMPKIAHVDFEKVRPYLNRDYAHEQLAAMHYNADAVLAAVGM